MLYKITEIYTWTNGETTNYETTNPLRKENSQELKNNNIFHQRLLSKMINIYSPIHHGKTKQNKKLSTQKIQMTVDLHKSGNGYKYEKKRIYTVNST